LFSQVDNPLPNEFDPSNFDPGEFNPDVESTLWIVSAFSSLMSFLYVVLLIWMIVECLRKDPDRYLWMFVMLVFQPFGPFIYFFVRWLPGNNIRLPKGIRRWERGKEIHRLESAALQIGNAHQFVQFGDVLRETGKHQKAGEAYSQALEKEPENCQALWGASLVDIEQKNFQAARNHLEKLLEIDPQYKFGDVSLAFGKTLYQLRETEEAYEHFQKYVKRWRHPEGLYLLATLQLERGDNLEARNTLQAMLMDINGSPRAIARKFGIWKSRARKLLKKLPTENVAKKP